MLSIIKPPDTQAPRFPQFRATRALGSRHLCLSLELFKHLARGQMVMPGCMDGLLLLPRVNLHVVWNGTKREGAFWLTLFTLWPRVSRHALAAEGAPLAMTAALVAAGWVAHVDTAAIGGQAARGAGLGVGRRAQVVQLSGGDREETGW